MVKETKKQETLEIPEKMEDFQQFETLKYLVEQKKSEFQALQGKITQYKTQLISLESRLVTMESEHKAKLNQEKQKFEGERQVKWNELVNRETVLQKAEGDYVRRRIELEEREKKAEELAQLKKSLFDEKIKYESLNNQAQARLNEANKTNEESLKRIDEATGKEKQVLAGLAEAKNILSINQNKEQELKVLQESVSTQTANLEALRKEVNPRIDELNALVKRNEELVEQLNKKEQALKEKIVEDEKLIETAKEENRKNERKALELATKEESLLRKELILKKENISQMKEKVDDNGQTV